MISVLHVITGLETGGAENTLIQLVTRLDRKAFAPTVISLTTEGPRGGELADAGVPLLAMRMKAGRPAPRAIWRLFDAIRRIRPALLQTWLPHADLLGHLTGRAAGVPAICWNIRNAELDPADHPFSLFWIVKLLAMMSSGPACIVSNSSAGRRAHEAVGYHPRRWELIPNGFDLARFTPSAERRASLRRRLGIPDDAPLVGMVARFHPMKDHHTFVAAAGLVGRAAPDARFLIVGRGVSPDNAGLSRQIVDSGIEAATFLEGECPDASLVFPALDIAVSSSYSEAFPNVVGEAMACGVPCVVTDVGDSKQIVGETGVVVPARVPEALADGILRLLNLGQDGRTELGRAARSRIANEYSIDAMVTRYEDLYRELVRRGGRS